MFPQHQAGLQSQHNGHTVSFCAAGWLGKRDGLCCLAPTCCCSCHDLCILVGRSFQHLCWLVGLDAKNGLCLFASQLANNTRQYKLTVLLLRAVVRTQEGSLMDDEYTSHANLGQLSRRHGLVGL